MRLLALLLLVGCQWTESPETIPCSTDDHCPDPWWCDLYSDTEEAFCTNADRDPDGDGFFFPEDCEPDDSRINPSALDIADDGIDANCDGVDGQDLDGDGHLHGVDCNDNDPDWHPDAEDVCGDGDDHNCDGVSEEDLDGDGSRPCGGDCDDDDPDRYPGAEEICNSVDDDCDGDGDLSDSDLDTDGDGSTRCFDIDCDDNDPLRFPDNPEVCDEVDNDCDGVLPADEGDTDGDLTIDCADCQPTDPAVHPGALEVCNDSDDDCDGTTWALDEDIDTDGDGSVDCLDCAPTDGTIHPTALESCDGIDTDCDAATNDIGEVDTDGDGFLACDDDCDDNDPAQNPAAAEACNGEDDDCNGLLDFPLEEIDDDGDGSLACADCDDADSFRSPDFQETCDGIDTDCDGVVPADELDGDGDGQPPCEGDCDDADPLNAGALDEECIDGQDNNCDGVADECNEWILYSTDRGTSGELNLWLQGPGNEEIQLTGLGGNETDAVISPDESKAAFVSDGSGQPEIWLADLNTFETGPLTDGECPEGISDPDWHPDGDRLIANCIQSATEHDLVEIDLLGTVTTFAEFLGQTGGASWAPDSSGLAERFTYEQAPNTFHVIRLRTPSGSVTELTGTVDTLPKGGPEWSDDSAWVAFSVDDGNEAIFRADIADTIVEQITYPTGDEQDSSPRWSPDSTFVIFERDIGGGDVDIFKVEIATETEEVILDGSYIESDPCWALFPPAFIPGSADQDGDGDPASSDCDDQNPDAYHGASEACDGFDTDCSGAAMPGEFDDDGDGHFGFPCGTDCNPGDPTVYVGAPELCDGMDNGCTFSTPPDEFDGDGDGFFACEDCDDTASDVNPDATEIVGNGVDDNCDGLDPNLCVPLFDQDSTIADGGSSLRQFGDIDDDGDIDRISWLSGSEMRVSYNDGGGTFTDTTLVSVGGGSAALALADLDGDGDLDIVHGRNNDGGAHILINVGSGTFSDSNLLLGGSALCQYEFYGLHPVDFDNDGDLDLVAAVECGITVFRNDGALSFVEVGSSVATGGYTPRLDLLDVNADGFVDVVAALSNGVTTRVLLNDGAGNFTNSTGWGLPSTLDGKDVAAVDLDGDGDEDDVLIADYDASLGGMVLFAATNNGGFTTTGSWQLVGVTPGSGDLTVGDINGDGIPDAVLGARGRSRVFYGDGAGGLTPAAEIPFGPYPDLVDVTADGTPDLFIGEHAADASVLLGECLSPPDLDSWGLLGHWPFDADSDDFLIDYGPLELHTDAGGAPLVQGRCGLGREYIDDPVSPSHTVWDDGSVPVIDGSDPVTIAAWFQLNTQPSTMWSEVFSYGATSGGVVHTLRWDSAGAPGWAFDDPSTSDAAFSTEGVLQGNWHSIIGVYDPTGGIRSIYVDGIEKNGSGTYSSSGVGSGVGYFALGGFDPSDSNHILGAIVDDAMVFSAALTPEEVAILAAMPCQDAEPDLFDGDSDGTPAVYDCDDSDPTIFPGADETPGDGIDQDCDGVDLIDVAEGQVVISEFIYNPLGGDSCGEYIEIRNMTTIARSLQGMVIGDGIDCLNMGDSHTIGDLVIPPSERVVLANESGTPDCAATDLLGAYHYPAAELVITDPDNLLLCAGTDIIDEVDWSVSGWSLPGGSGNSFGLNPDFDPSIHDNNDASLWCTQTSTFSTPYLNQGTPGTTNDPC